VTDDMSVNANAEKGGGKEVAIVDVADAVDSNKIIALEDITCYRSNMPAIVYMIILIFGIAYLASTITTFKIENYHL
jgi:hypothetical protein